MKKKQVSKQVYMAPTCRVIQVQTESFICTSVTPSASGSSTDTSGWSYEQDVSGGTIYVGDSEVAP